MTTTSLLACSFFAVTCITWSRGTLDVYNNNSTNCNDLIVFYYAHESCVLGRRKSFLRKRVAYFFHFKAECWCALKRVVNLKKNPMIGTQEQYQIPRNSGSR